MNIKSAKYVISYLTGKNSSITLTLNDDTIRSVPLVVGNRHYDAIQEWVAKGNTIEEAD
jgi:hypothetical protein